MVNPFYFKRMINLSLKLENWCSYDGNCKLDILNIPNRYEYCFICKYKKDVDIPEMINKQIEKVEKDE